MLIGCLQYSQSIWLAGQHIWLLGVTATCLLLHPTPSVVTACYMLSTCICLQMGETAADKPSNKTGAEHLTRVE